MLADLGPCTPLPDALTPGHPHALRDEHRARTLGARLGRFFGALHAPTALTIAEAHPDAACFGARHEAQASARALLARTTVDPVGPRLQAFGAPDAAALAAVVADDFARDDRPEERAFTLGDAWTGAVLLGPGDGDVAVVDWEFAGVGRGAAGDAAMLEAHWELQALAAGHDAEMRRVVGAMMGAFREMYDQMACEGGFEWVVGGGGKDGPSVTERRVRAAECLLKGREMTNYAFDREWMCQCCDGGQKEGCELRRSMLQKGLQYLRQGARHAQHLENLSS